MPRGGSGCRDRTRNYCSAGGRQPAPGARVSFGGRRTKALVRVRRLSCGLSFAFAGERAHLTDNSLLHFGELKVCLLQLQTTVAALFVVSLPGKPGTRRSLPSETFCNRQSRAPIICRPHRSIFYPATQQLRAFPGHNAPGAAWFSVAHTRGGACRKSSDWRSSLWHSNF